MMQKIRDSVVEFALYIAQTFGNICGVSGGLLVVLGYASEFDSGWLPPNLQAGAAIFSAILSISGAFLSVASIWAPPNTRPPDGITKKFSAPIIMFFLVGTGIYWILFGKPNDTVINGLAMLGVATAVLRLLSQGGNIPS